jgi:hypothetical protein
MKRKFLIVLIAAITILTSQYHVLASYAYLSAFKLNKINNPNYKYYSLLTQSMSHAEHAQWNQVPQPILDEYLPKKKRIRRAVLFPSGEVLAEFYTHDTVLSYFNFIYLTKQANEKYIKSAEFKHINP